jgi:hypothetical protein
MQVKETCVARGASLFILKAGSSPIPSSIMKVDVSPFITKAGVSPILSPITKVGTPPFFMKANMSPIPYIERDER